MIICYFFIKRFISGQSNQIIIKSDKRKFYQLVDELIKDVAPESMKETTITSLIRFYCSEYLEFEKIQNYVDLMITNGIPLKTRTFSPIFQLVGDVKDIHMTDLINGKESLKDIQFLGAVGGFSNSDVLGSAKGWAGSFRFNDRARKALEDFFFKKRYFINWYL